jgi:hypothetical protein
MATFAKLDVTNTVVEIIKVGNDVPTSNGPLGQNDMHIDGEKYCNELLGGTWKQSSFSGAFRGRPAGIGSTYDAQKDVFINPQEYVSWTLDANNDWQPPVAKPTLEQELYVSYDRDNCNPTLYGSKWNEEQQRWEATDINNVLNIWNPNTSSWSPA